jgi:6,7-dimethyl-8-ribityllumazine synthase
MSTDSPNPPILDPAPFSFGIVCSRFNESLTQSLLDRVIEVLNEQGTPAQIIIERVPGAHEVPAGLSLLADSGRFSTLIGLGVVIKGSTSHHHLVAESAGHAIQSLVVQHRLPIINGIVVTDDLTTAEERITGKLDRGKEFAHAALEMASLRKKWI